MLYHVSKDFLRLHFAVDQFKGSVSCFIKNMAVKIPTLILAFVYFANFLLSLL